jgi:hypothetical protein
VVEGGELLHTIQVGDREALGANSVSWGQGLGVQVAVGGWAR